MVIKFLFLFRFIFIDFNSICCLHAKRDKKNINMYYIYVQLHLPQGNA